MKNKLVPPIRPGDDRVIHDEAYEPAKLMEESTRPKETKRPPRPQKAVKGVTTKK